MKTFSINRVLLAGLAAVLVTSAACADDVGVVRLGRRASTVSPTGAGAVVKGDVVVRGQSDSCPPSAPESRGLLQWLSKSPKDASAGTDYTCDRGSLVQSCNGCDVTTGGEASKGGPRAPGCRCESCKCCDCSPVCNCDPCECCKCTDSSESCACCDCSPVCNCDPCECCKCTDSSESSESGEGDAGSNPWEDSKSAAEFNPREDIQIVAGLQSRNDPKSTTWWDRPEDREHSARILEPRTDAVMTYGFLEPCTGSAFVESFLQPYGGLHDPQSFVRQCSGADDPGGHVASHQPYIGDASSDLSADYAQGVGHGSDSRCDAGCVSGCDSCGVSCDDSHFGHHPCHAGGLRSLFGDLFGFDSGGSGAVLRHGYGPGKCRDCNGRGCRRCRRHAHGSRRDVRGLGGGRFHDGPFHCPHGYVGGRCPICTGRACVNDNFLASFLGGQAARYRARNQLASQGVNAYLRCKLGYFLPDGCGGVGCMPVGCYSIVYPNNPGYFDGRDGQVYAAQGYGGPVSVPLAPVVRQTYNYGWGIPSSRLTPISHPVY